MLPDDAEGRRAPRAVGLAALLAVLALLGFELGRAPGVPAGVPLIGLIVLVVGAACLPLWRPAPEVRPERRDEHAPATRPGGAETPTPAGPVPTHLWSADGYREVTGSGAR